MTKSSQLGLFKQEEFIRKTGLDSKLWRGSFNGRESTIQQLSPYLGKMKSGMARALISLFSNSGDVVLDPFSGSGVVPFEAALMKRRVLANDLSPYAYVLTRGKLEAPSDKEMALQRTRRLIESIETVASQCSLESVPHWVNDFFHPDTLREVITAFNLLREKEDHFLISCLLGILHHQRPGFLSYPASHLVPYLRISKFPPEEYPEMYEYRDLRSRLIAKVQRAYRRPRLPADWSNRKYKVLQVNSMELPIDNGEVDSIISSPPYFGALDYARDNRLRLWFLGCHEWRSLDEKLTANSKVYISQMSSCIEEMYRVLKPGAYCVLVLGDVDRGGKIRRTAEIIADLANEVTNGGFRLKTIYDDRIPDERRARRKTKTAKYDRIVVMNKTS